MHIKQLIILIGGGGGGVLKCNIKIVYALGLFYRIMYN